MTVLVVSTVHSADDTRIRERLVRTLSDGFEVVYATRPPGPSDRSGLTWVGLHGGRARRWWAALRLLASGGWDVAVIHDPELIPAAVVARVVRRRPVVFDVHEDLGAQIATKEWIPRWLRPPARLLARFLYWLAERALVLTLAEEGYRGLFRRDHPVFPNHPTYVGWPDPVEEGDGTVVYVGDVSVVRGVVDAAEAARRSGLRFRVVGPVPESLRGSLTDAELLGRRPNPEALRLAASATVGISPLRDAPNYRQSLPTKVLEYLALGLPVVATDLPGTREVAGRWDGVWLVPPGDVDAMAGALREAAHPEARALARSRAAQVRTRFIWPRATVLDWYRRLAQEAETPGEVHHRQRDRDQEGGGAGTRDRQEATDDQQA